MAHGAGERVARVSLSSSLTASVVAGLLTLAHRLLETHKGDAEDIGDATNCGRPIRRSCMSRVSDVSGMCLKARRLTGAPDATSDP